MRQKVALAARWCTSRSHHADEPPPASTPAPRGGEARAGEGTREGVTVVMTTHILEVAERMADRIGIIAHGRLIAEGTLDELRRRAGNGASNLEETFLTLVAEPAEAA